MPDAQGNPTLQDYQQEVQNAITTLQNSPNQNEVPQKIQYMQQLASTIDSIGKYGLSVTDPTISNFLQNAVTLNIPQGQVQTNVQKLNDYVMTQGQAAYQQKQYQDLTNQQNAAYQQQKTDLLASIPGLASNINTNLVSTEQQALTNLQPQIQDYLNAAGLYTSGALPEAEAKTQGQLDVQRQNQINNFIQQATSEAGLQIPMEQLNTDVGNLASATQGNIDLSQAGVTNAFNLQNQFNDEQFQMQMQQEALANARSLAQLQANTANQDAWISAGANIIRAAPAFFAG